MGILTTEKKKEERRKKEIKMAKSPKKAENQLSVDQVAGSTQAVEDAAKGNNNSTTDITGELAKTKAVIPVGAKPLAMNIDKDATIQQARVAFAERAKSSQSITDEMVEATETVIDLIEQGKTWADVELREAFKKVPNSFAKGPVLSTELQLLCGKIAKFDNKEVPIYRTGDKINGRFIYQDAVGFQRVIGRFPIDKAEVATDPDLKADIQGASTFLSHDVLNEIDFWCTEPQHQIHCPTSSRLIKRPSTTRIDTIQDVKQSLEAGIRRYEEIYKSAPDDVMKTVAQNKLKSLREKLASLQAA